MGKTEAAVSTTSAQQCKFWGDIKRIENALEPAKASNYYG
jgi:hypothetical protein